jgi:hypothetical protein
LLLAIQKEIPNFVPPTLKEHFQGQENGKAKVLLVNIKELLLDFTLTTLQDEFGEEENEWWNEGVPDVIRQGILQKCERDKEKLLEKEKYIDFQDYMVIIQANWNLFKGTLGHSSSLRYSPSRLAWLQAINNIQDLVNHDKIVTPAQLDELFRYADLLRGYLSQIET